MIGSGLVWFRGFSGLRRIRVVLRYMNFGKIQGLMVWVASDAGEMKLGHPSTPLSIWARGFWAARKISVHHLVW